MTLLSLIHRVKTGMPIYSSDSPVAVELHADFETDGYRASRLEPGTHADAHVDAPAHTEPDDATLDDFPADDLRFAARAIDCRGAGPHDRIGPDAIPERLRPRVDFLALRTGWEDERGTERMADHPALEPEMARACADHRLSVGVDALSPDPAGGDGVPAHRAILGAGLLVVENLCRLDALPTDRTFDLYVMPLQVDADSASARVVADAETGLIRRRDGR